MRIVLRDSAQKDLKKINILDQANIINKIKTLKSFSNTVNTKRLVNFSSAFRLRVGKYRVLFDSEDEIIYVSRIIKRDKAYK